MIISESKMQALTQHFQSLVHAQAARIEAIDKRRQMPLSQSGPITIGICPGDGIGPIICEQTERVLYRLLSDRIERGEIVVVDIPGLTIESRIAQAESVPEDVLEKIKCCDVLLKGPTTTPQMGPNVPNLESANVRLRRELDLYANVRPVRVPERQIDWMFFRENTEGEYALGSHGIDIEGLMAFDFKVTTYVGTRRIAKAAFDYARRCGKSRVAIVTKANILKKTDGLFSAVCREVAQDFPEIVAEDWYVDIMSANLINEAMQKEFEVLVMPNLYGDILTDEAAQLQGGVGTAGSANIGDRYAMFEAIHGSAPRMIEKGLGAYANPSSMLKALEMLLDHIGCVDEAKRLLHAMDACLKESRVVVTGTAEGATCADFTDYVLSHLG